MRPLILAASRNRTLRAFAREHGLRIGAARFVAGTTLDDFVRRARELNAAGYRVSCAYLGEGVADRTAAARIAEEFLAILDRLAAERLDSSLALKLTHLGLALGTAVARESVARIVERAATHGIFVRIDMEESAYVEVTLEIYRELRRRGLENVGVVLQSYLRRSPTDLAGLLPLRPNVRIVKGAYREPGSLAFGWRGEIDAAFLELVRAALDGGAYVAVATHDDRLIEAAITMRPPSSEERLEIQMLLGVRDRLREGLVARGLPVRVSVPFGGDWYPYLMRRLAEKPSNLWLVLRNLFPPSS